MRFHGRKEKMRQATVQKRLVSSGGLERMIRLRGKEKGCSLFIKGSNYQEVRGRCQRSIERHWRMLSEQ